MIVLLPSLTTHEIRIAPRRYELETQNLFITNEATLEETNVTIDSITQSNGYWVIGFDFTVAEGERYYFRVENLRNEINYRGLIFCTLKETQNYSVHDN